MRCALLTQVRVDWSCERERSGTVISTEYLVCLEVRRLSERKCAQRQTAVTEIKPLHSIRKHLADKMLLCALLQVTHNTAQACKL